MISCDLFLKKNSMNYVKLFLICLCSHSFGNSFLEQVKQLHVKHKKKKTFISFEKKKRKKETCRGFL